MNKARNNVYLNIVYIFILDRYDVVNQQTEDLVKELGDLRSQMKQVIAVSN